MHHADEHSESLPYLFVTGGAGYIGSHFLDHWARVSREHVSSHRLVVLDDLSGGHFEILNFLDEEFTRNYVPTVIFEKVDLCDFSCLNDLFEKYKPKAVVHFAGKISVAESVEKPEFYHKNNVEGSENLLLAMKQNDCKRIVFSSTAAVYGAREGTDPIDEDALLAPMNPYGVSKLRIEQAIAEASEDWGLQGIIFRYFNAAGASSSGQIGEWHEPETHLIPLLIESAMNPDAELKVFGKDYPTRDGTCIRDYIHVTDLAHAHVLGVARLLKNEVRGVEIFNLGTEIGTTVLEVISALQKVTQKRVKTTEFPRRPGDAPFLVASSASARFILGWNPIHSDIETILRTALVWHQRLKALKGIR